jgi:hypothetical protein
VSESPYSIIFMPGIRPKPLPQEHERQIRRCLHNGIESVGGSEQEAQEIAAAFSLVGWSHSFYKEHGDVSADLPGIERLLAGQDDEAQTLREARSPAHQITAFFYALADRFPPLVRHFSTQAMQSRMGEIGRYFANADGESVRVRQLLVERLQEAWGRKQKVVLVGHSFGSVIGYDVLWELSRDGCEHSVDLFLSLGSPLTMGYIRNRLQGAHLHGAERYPRLIKRWVNYAAVGEVTALDRKLAKLFAPMVEHGLVDSISDDLGLVNCFHGPQGLNVHKCYGYFSSRLVGGLLLDWHRNH